MSGVDTADRGILVRGKHSGISIDSVNHWIPGSFDVTRPDASGVLDSVHSVYHNVRCAPVVTYVSVIDVTFYRTLIQL